MEKAEDECVDEGVDVGVDVGVDADAEPVPVGEGVMYVLDSDAGTYVGVDERSVVPPFNAIDDGRISGASE